MLIKRNGVVVNEDPREPLIKALNVRIRISRSEQLTSELKHFKQALLDGESYSVKGPYLIINGKRILYDEG